MGNKFLHKNRVQKKNQYLENLENLLVLVPFLRGPTEELMRRSLVCHEQKAIKKYKISYIFSIPHKMSYVDDL
jgi:hypothetical protein